MKTHPDSQLQQELIKLGQRLRSLRHDRGWTLGTLSKQAHLSEAYLSRLESGDRQPSLGVLFELTRVYEVSLADLLQSTATATSASADDHTALSPNSVIIRASNRPLRTGNGLFYQSLAGDSPLAELHPLRVVVPANRQGAQLYQHSGEEWLYVLSGQIILTLGDEEYLLNPGDAAHFDAYIPHQLAVASAQDAEIILVACASAKSLFKSYLYNESLGS